MIPKKQSFERVKVGEFIFGEILDIEYDMEHKFRSYEKGEPDRFSEAVRFVFKLKGYEYPHKSRWMTFSLNERANLYVKYVSKLVDESYPEMSFDLDALKGSAVKTIWKEDKIGPGKIFQSIENIFAVGEKVKVQIIDSEEELSDLEIPPEMQNDDPDNIPESKTQKTTIEPPAENTEMTSLGDNAMKEEPLL